MKKLKLTISATQKCRYILILTGLVIATRLSAQVGDYRNEFAIGVNGGMMMSSVGFSPRVPQKQLAGLSGGITLRYTCEKYFKSICAVVAEVNYVQTGWKEDILDVNDNPCFYADDPDHPLYYERKMNYVQIPVMARLGWGRERNGLQAFFQLCPQVGFFLNEKTNTNLVKGYEPTEQRASYITAQDTMAVENKFDYGIAVGAGMEYSHPKLGHFLLEGRYYYGLGNIFGNTKSDYFGKSNFGQIVVKLTYLFDVFKTNNSKIK